MSNNTCTNSNNSTDIFGEQISGNNSTENSQEKPFTYSWNSKVTAKN